MVDDTRHTAFGIRCHFVLNKQRRSQQTRCRTIYHFQSMMTQHVAGKDYEKASRKLLLLSAFSLASFMVFYSKWRRKGFTLISIKLRRSFLRCSCENWAKFVYILNLSQRQKHVQLCFIIVRTEKHVFFGWK